MANPASQGGRADDSSEQHPAEYGTRSADGSVVAVALDQNVLASRLPALRHQLETESLSTNHYDIVSIYEETLGNDLEAFCLGSDPRETPVDDLLGTDKCPTRISRITFSFPPLDVLRHRPQDLRYVAGSERLVETFHELDVVHPTP
jgi:hypothetical protein